MGPCNNTSFWFNLINWISDGTKKSVFKNDTQEILDDSGDRPDLGHSVK